ncbi:peptidoglycan recognition protein family protein [Embleya scabrispora]|uniref:peptidoglycan recognition protein family protein n=1 Tax=Embleya scabrispora TaxID=159449 RepID=UPI00037AC75C|nr:N-acetylmuramoyl-L-alanine amidase [Embleya scabrispora]
MYTRIALSIAALAVPVVLAGPPAQAEDRPSTPGSTVTLPLTGAEQQSDAAAPRAGRTEVLTAERGTPAYSLVGVTWVDAGAGARVVVHVRTRTGGVWSPWHELHAGGEGTGGVDGGLRGGTEPFWAGRSDGIQVRVGVPDGVLPQDLRAELVDPGESILDRTPPRPSRPTHAGGRAIKGHADRPPIVARKDWGADESLRNAKFKYTNTVRAAFVHHTADGNDFPCSDSAKVLRSIYRYHVKTNGWADVGYNFLVDKCGTIFEGRAGGTDKPVLGAHTLGFNTDTMGVAAMGTYTTAAPLGPMLIAMSRVIAWKLGLDDRDPKGKATLTSSDSGSRYAKGTTHAFDVISGHRDAFNTECPGQALYGQLPAIRNDVALRVG